MKEKYMPSSAEIKKGEEMMTEEERKESKIKELSSFEEPNSEATIALKETFGEEAIEEDGAGGIIISGKWNSSERSNINLEYHDQEKTFVLFLGVSLGSEDDPIEPEDLMKNLSKMLEVKNQLVNSGYDARLNLDKEIYEYIFEKEVDGKDLKNELEKLTGHVEITPQEAYRA